MYTHAFLTSSFEPELICNRNVIDARTGITRNITYATSGPSSLYSSLTVMPVCPEMCLWVSLYIFVVVLAQSSCFASPRCPQL